MQDGSIAFARHLRRRQTDAEWKLWQILRAGRLRGWKFRRQQPIGRYIVDFVCFEKRLVIELDGGQHQDRAGEDRERDDWLAAKGFEVLRFWNNDVMQNLEGVVERINQELSPSPRPSPIEGEGAHAPLSPGGRGAGGEGRTEEPGK
jgi:very-short-patch-repair endonuclease